MQKKKIIFFNSCNRFSFRKTESYNKADDESKKKKKKCGLNIYIYIYLISQNLSTL